MEGSSSFIIKKMIADSSSPSSLSSEKQKEIHASVLNLSWLDWIQHIILQVGKTWQIDIEATRVSSLRTNRACRSENDRRRREQLLWTRKMRTHQDG